MPARLRSARMFNPSSLPHYDGERNACQCEYHMRYNAPQKIHVGRPQKKPLVFYAAASGREPVRDWLKALDIEDRRIVGLDLMRVQYAWPVGMPLCRSLGEGLWEVRSALTGGKIARVLFCFHGQRLYAVHGFIKKSQKTPSSDLGLALKRKKDIEDGE
jgi:phage-related protein